MNWICDNDDKPRSAFVISNSHACTTRRAVPRLRFFAAPVELLRTIVRPAAADGADGASEQMVANALAEQATPKLFSDSRSLITRSSVLRDDSREYHRAP